MLKQNCSCKEDLEATFRRGEMGLGALPQDGQEEGPWSEPQALEGLLNLVRAKLILAFVQVWDTDFKNK